MSFQPAEFVPLERNQLQTLKRRQAQVLCALAEAVIGADFASVIGGAAGAEAGYRAFVLDLDDFFTHQRKSVVAQLHIGLKFLEVGFLRRLLLVNVGDDDFSRLSRAERLEVLEAMRSPQASDEAKQLYVGVVRLVSSFYFGHERVWPSIGYPGPSVDDQDVLAGHPWRPNDPRPVES